MFSLCKDECFNCAKIIPRVLERSTRVLKKLLFIRCRQYGDSVETAAGRIQGPYTEMSQKGPVKDVA